MPNNRNATSRAGSGRYGAVSRKGSGIGVSYGSANAEALRRCVSAVTGAGDAVTFGRTSDGGAYYVGVLSNGVLERWYLDNLDDLQDTLEAIAEAGEALIQ